jgi:hypothetical protein
VSQWFDAPSFENAQLFWRYADKTVSRSEVLQKWLTPEQHAPGFQGQNATSAKSLRHPLKSAKPMSERETPLTIIA